MTQENKFLGHFNYVYFLSYLNDIDKKIEVCFTQNLDSK